MEGKHHEAVDSFVHHQKKRGYGDNQQYFGEPDPERCAARPVP